VIRSFVLFATLFGVWLAWSGHYTPFLVGVGAACSASVVWIARRMGLVDREGVPYEIVPRTLLYMPWLLWEIARANVDVAKRILAPGMPIRPHLIRSRALQRSDLARAIYANSITLTPGTVSIAIEGDDVIVHALTDEAAKDVLGDEMNRRVAGLEKRS